MKSPSLKVLARPPGMLWSIRKPIAQPPSQHGARYLDVCSGIGGFALGIRRAAPDAVCVGFAEIDPHAVAIYQRHFPGHPARGDLRVLAADALPDFDLLVAGFPCQAFSIAGWRAGFADPGGRGQIFFAISRLARQKRPRLLLLENVKGLLSHGDGDTFRTILRTLHGLGYDCEWQLLNSKHFGVPQNRERLFIVGHLRGTPRPQVFPLDGASDTHPPARRDAASPAQEYIATRHLGRNGGLRARLAATVQASETPHVTDGETIRRLMPCECERLQGFPDDWTRFDSRGREIPDRHRYRCLGNAVTVPVVARIAERLLAAIPPTAVINLAANGD